MEAIKKCKWRKNAMDCQNPEWKTMTVNYCAQGTFKWNPLKEEVGRKNIVASIVDET